MKLTRMKRAGVLLGAAAALIVGTTACDPAPPGPGHAPLAHHFEPSFHIKDNLGNIVYRAGSHETITTQWPSLFVTSGGAPWGTSVGWAHLIDGGTLELYNGSSVGTTGQYQADRPIRTHWNAQANYTIYGYGLHIGMGGCDLTDYITSFGENLSSRGITVHCTKLNAIPWAETGAGYRPQGSEANKAAYYKLTTAQKKKVMQTINRVQQLTLTGVSAK